MDTLVPNHVNFKVKSIIHYLFIVKKQKPGDIFQEVAAAYRNVMLCEKLSKWSRNFTEGQTFMTKKGEGDLR